eukprot:302357-Prymnesium_polylepis.1
MDGCAGTWSLGCTPYHFDRNRFSWLLTSSRFVSRLFTSTLKKDTRQLFAPKCHELPAPDPEPRQLILNTAQSARLQTRMSKVVETGRTATSAVNTEGS